MPHLLPKSIPGSISPSNLAVEHFPLMPPHTMDLRHAPSNIRSRYILPLQDFGMRGFGRFRQDPLKILTDLSAPICRSLDLNSLGLLDPSYSFMRTFFGATKRFHVNMPGISIAGCTDSGGKTSGNDDVMAFGKTSSEALLIGVADGVGSSTT